ncbi:hypothetical protein E3P99_03331 [Wallemia hederae]|uniref:Thioredoxin domain-containing protein n=1 Tax=Wallemia hederae TaxID=1540922 RepID=A0A4T0FGL0_9BASI|nr:hypothetical protein E3P99_03331 [Wallemia hederae]
MKISILSIAALLGISNAALFTANDPVKNIDSLAFDSAVLNNPYSTSVISFTAPWCGHCQRLTSQLNNAAKSLDGMVSFYNVDCDNDMNRSLCSKYQVRGFPTIKSFTRGKKAPPRDYNGERTSAAISEWAGSQVRNLVSRLSDFDAVEKWLKNDENSPHILVYTNKATTSTLLKALAQQFPGAKFGIMKSTSRNKDVKDALGLNGELTSPAVYIINDGSLEGAEKYQGKLKFKALKEWLQDSLPASSKIPVEDQKDNKNKKDKSSKKKAKSEL